MLDGQRDKALVEGGRQQEPLGGGPDTPSAAQKLGADQPLRAIDDHFVYISHLCYFSSTFAQIKVDAIICFLLH